ncbi:MAG TPA: xylulokinase [Casimicrobiaceae bacterium]|nr:xylulokinase [Casimicrobiaceae bacterium]
MFLGIDIGTSAVKGVLVDDADRVLAEASAPLEVHRPAPLWAEQDPESWWTATQAVIDRLAASHAMTSVVAIGLSGQMLAVTLLDERDRPLRPAMLWNDGRAAAECTELESRVPDFAQRVGCRAMPGFPAPKLAWLARHEPAMLARARRVMLAKDYVRLLLTGEAVSDVADASATLLMDTLDGRWSDEIATACGISTEQLPRLVASGEVSGQLQPKIAARWGFRERTPIAGGAGDNMCGGVGAGVTSRGDAFISLGTSGVYFVANDRFVPALSRGMHTHRHAVDGLFCQQAVVLSAASSLSWLAHLLRVESVERFVADIEGAALAPDDVPLFTPYLGGERTPYNDPLATATISGMRFTTTPLHLGRAVLDGVALAIADCHDALLADGAPVERIRLIGGGARSNLWAEIIATVLDRALELPADGVVGPALGAARLARQSVGGPLLGTAEAHHRVVAPRREWRDAYARKRDAFHTQYAALRER